MGIICFGNDPYDAITGYGDYVHGNITICHVYYVEGLGHNLFFVGKFCDGDLEVGFHSKACYVQNLECDDLLTGARDSNLYTISISEMAASSPVCLMSKAYSTKFWLWHHYLSHLNFATINQLAKQDMVVGLLKFKYDKDHLCSALVVKKQSSLVDTSIPNVEITGLSSYPPLPTQGSTPAGNTPGISSYANVTGAPSRKALNFRTLFTLGGNEVNVVVLVESIRAISESSMDDLHAMLKNGPWFIHSHLLILKKWNPDVNLLSSFARAMIELRADMELKDTIVEECPKNIGSGEAKNLKKPSQTPRGVPVGPVGYEWGASNLASNGANSNGSSFWNVKTSSTSTTPIVDKIGKLEKLIIDGKVTFVDDDSKPLKKERVGFSTTSLVEQLRDTYENGDYDEDPYDDDIYEGHDLLDKIQDICDTLDIRVRGLITLKLSMF
ncbi:integrase, catalytic region, zinc finger, CCHC-type containing protein [Tanacetum coccineum]